MCGNAIGDYVPSLVGAAFITDVHKPLTVALTECWRVEPCLKLMQWLSEDVLVHGGSASNKRDNQMM